MALKKKAKARTARPMARSVYKKGGSVGSVKSVKAPAGFHWMKSGNSFKLMKHSGKFVPHKGASLVAKFKVQKKHSK